MTTPELPSDLWIKILYSLRKPIPAPLSSPSRSAIRQGDLASASRVCRLWHEICEKPLHEYIVTDEFASLILNTSSLANNTRFAHTKKLYIEYWDKTAVKDATYGMIMARGEHMWDFGLVPHGQALEMARCSEEVEGLTLALEALAPPAPKEGDRGRRIPKGLGMAQVFPALQTIAVSSIWGCPSDVWGRYTSGNEEIEKTSSCNECSYLFENFITSDKLLHYCVRDTGGPLSPATFSHKYAHAPASTLQHTTTVHFGAELARMPVVLAGNIRWVSDISMDTEWINMLQGMGDAIAMVNQWRHNAGSPCFWQHHLDIDIYFSTGQSILAPGVGTSLNLMGLGNEPLMYADVLKKPREITPKMQKKICAKLGSLLSAWFSDDRNGNPTHAPEPGPPRADVVRWHTSAQTPRCESCGSGQPA